MRASYKLKLIELGRQGSATLLGFQPSSSEPNCIGDRLYNVKWDNNPANHSTVSAETLNKLGIKKYFITTK